MGSKSRGKDRVPKSSGNSQEEYEPLFQAPPNSLDFSNYRSPVTSPTNLASSPEHLVSELSPPLEPGQWNQTSRNTNSNTRSPAGIFNNLAFRGPHSPEPADLPSSLSVISRSTRSSEESRSGDLDHRTLTNILDSHHSSLLGSVRSALEMNNSFLHCRLEEVVVELRGLRKDLERVRNRGRGDGEKRLMELQVQLDREREMRKMQAAEHDAEMECLLRQLSDVM